MDTNKDIFTKEIISQWKKTWSTENLLESIKHCSKDKVLLPIFLKYLPKNDKILEAGCGIGSWLVYLNKIGYDIVGVDIVEDCIRICKTQFPEIDIRLGDVRKLDFPDEFFGGYISLGVVEHMIEGPKQTLLEAKRVLKKGGVAIITVPAYNYFLKIYFPIRKTIIDFFRYSSLIRKFFKKSVILNKYEFKRKMFIIKKNLKKELWPIISIVEGMPVFSEYRYPRGYLDRVLKDFGFEILVSKPIFYPIVFYSTFGRWVMKDKRLDELNIIGKIINVFFKLFGPNFFNAYFLYVVKKI